MHFFCMGSSVCKSLAGTAVDEIMKIGGRGGGETEILHSGVLHRVDDEYTGAGVQEETRPRLCDRERVATDI